MRVRIGHASISETGTIDGQRADQTGREVTVTQWYDKNWLFLLRPKTREIAERSAEFCEKICANECVGYGQGDRNSLREEILRIGFDRAQALDVPCNTDCSALMALCAEAAGVPVPYYQMPNGQWNAQTTYTMKTDFPATGMYALYEQTQYRDTDAYLMRGDILVSAGHTVMVLEDGPLAAGREDELEMTKDELLSAAGTGDNPTDWAREATQWAKENGVFNGDGAGNFGWQQPITREAVAQVLYNLAQRMGMA